MPYTLLQVIDQVRQRADMVGSTFVTTDEVAVYVAESKFELFELLANVVGDAVPSLQEVQIAAGASNATIGASYYRILRVDWVHNDARYPLRRYNFHDLVARTTSTTWHPALDITYSLYEGGAKITVDPPPAVTTTLGIYYHPQDTRITTMSQPITGLVDRWVEYVVIDAAIKCKEKEESDTTALERAKQNMIGRIERYSARLDRNPMYIGDTRRDDEDEELAVWY